jgi:cell fate regulator YaaT (PSP1 superfamily)
MNELEYLVSYGLAGDFGRFRSLTPLRCRRGERVVVRSHRGVEVGHVLRAATARHAAFLPNTTLGQVLRAVTAEDEGKQDTLRERGRRLFERGVDLADELELPLEVLDAEVLLDGDHAALHLLRWADSDVRPFIATLSREFALHIQIADLSRPKEEEHQEEAHDGCGREGCGNNGGCGSCGTGGGCGSCGTEKAPDMTAHFAQLREQMEQGRVGLL